MQFYHLENPEETVRATLLTFFNVQTRVQFLLGPTIWYDSMNRILHPFRVDS